MTSLLNSNTRALRRRPFTARLSQLLHTLRLWQLRTRSRRQLAQLDDRQLADIGISASERREELDKPFWR